MRPLFLCLALLASFPVAGAQDENASFGLHVDSRDVALSLWHGRIQWRVEALDVLPLPEIEPFDGLALAEQGLLAQELLTPPFDFEDERRFFLSVTIAW